ncbi:MAG: hypothetical protein ABSC95_01845 [Acetobacteraceae bacterium]|jgi:hypothetical protein
MTLKVSIADMMVANRLRDAVGQGVSPADIRFAQESDLAPEDVRALRQITQSYRLLIVLRCPKRGAVAFHGVFRAKRWADGHDSAGNLVKSGVSGIGVHPETGNIFVSDYDMMSLWVRTDAGGYRKLFASALEMHAERGPWSKEAMATVRLLNGALTSPLQHGAQDDFTPPPGKRHPGVSADTRFCAFREGEASYLEGMAACAAYYQKWGLYWPYDADGGFTRALQPGG